MTSFDGAGNASDRGHSGPVLVLGMAGYPVVLTGWIAFISLCNLFLG